MCCQVEKVRSECPLVESSIFDVWEKLGSPNDTQFTWDCTKNDNLFEDSSVSFYLKVNHNKYILDERLLIGMFYLLIHVFKLKCLGFRHIRLRLFISYMYKINHYLEKCPTS